MGESAFRAHRSAIAIRHAWARRVEEQCRRPFAMMWLQGIRAFVTSSLARFAMALMPYARRHKRVAKTNAATLSELLVGFERGRVARDWLAIVAWLNKKGVPVLARTSGSLLKNALLWTISVHEAAGEHSRSVRMARLLNVLFRASIRSRELPTTFVYVDALFRPGLYGDISREFPNGERLSSIYLAQRVALAQAYLERPLQALATLDRSTRAAAAFWVRALQWRYRGLANVLRDEWEQAEVDFQQSVDAYPQSVMAHQNYAGRYDRDSYVPAAWELRNGGKLLPYDALNLAAESLFLGGDALRAMRLYQRGLQYQLKLRTNSSVPASVTAKLKQAFDHFDAEKPIRILPYEWCTQFGHIALLDANHKMAAVGIYSDSNPVVLAPHGKVANECYLGHFEHLFHIVRDGSLVDELFPYQRYVGDNFMALLGPDRHAEPWTRAAARAQIIWAQDRRGTLLKLDPAVMEAGEATLAKMGIDSGRWYVGLHVRAGSFYGESKGGISDHRNGRLADYIPAIRDVVDRGGIVVRLGDRAMEPLPTMEGVFDYALSDYKSAAMDLFFLATSKFVIGTTSGLTTAALSFGTPMVLVNCISNDWQLWSDEADFIVKKVWCQRRKRYLSLAETYRMPFQGSLINRVLLERRGFQIHANTADEVQAAVRFKLSKVLDGRQGREPEAEILHAYDNAINGNPYIFGAANPVPEFLRMNDFLLDPAKSSDESPTDWPSVQDEARREFSVLLD